MVAIARCWNPTVETYVRTNALRPNIRTESEPILKRVMIRSAYADRTPLLEYARGPSDRRSKPSQPHMRRAGAFAKSPPKTSNPVSVRARSVAASHPRSHHSRRRRFPPLAPSSQLSLPACLPSLSVSLSALEHHLPLPGDAAAQPFGPRPLPLAIPPSLPVSFSLIPFPVSLHRRLRRPSCLPSLFVLVLFFSLSALEHRLPLPGDVAAQPFRTVHIFPRMRTWFRAVQSLCTRSEPSFQKQ